MEIGVKQQHFLPFAFFLLLSLPSSLFLRTLQVISLFLSYLSPCFPYSSVQGGFKDAFAPFPLSLRFAVLHLRRALFSSILLDPQLPVRIQSHIRMYHSN
eukprot:GILI01049867.1.p1 GENE.GILI01049867.1~~GILI01049867.1.p1  ORF type:complete len:100 (+),score=5.97 GILI01049867.1:178-477(+)